MPHNASAAKRLRQNLKRRTRNRDRLTELKTLRKQMLRALHDGKADEAKTLFTTLTRRVDQAAAKQTIHGNAAARLKARMAVRLNAPAPVAKAKSKPIKKA
jgi:small subunit ribosomal protein S20